MVPSLSQLCLNVLPVNVLPVKVLPGNGLIQSPVCNETDPYLQEMNAFYVKNNKNLKIAHLNINSVRHKFVPITEMLSKSMIDIMLIQETKIDSSFPEGQFSMKDFVTYRKDVTDKSGGIMVIVRSDLPQRLRPDLQMTNVPSGRIETLVIELTLRKEK